MSIEQQDPTPMRNADGEEVKPTKLTSGEVLLLTEEQYQNLVSQGLVRHSGVHHDEKPHDETAKIFPELQGEPIPDTKLMILTPSERKLARTTQRQAEKPKFLQRTSTRIGALVLAGAVVVGGGVALRGGGGNEKPDSAQELEATVNNPDALNVDGNLYPEKANPDYDAVFGITTELDNDGHLTNLPDLYDQWGMGTISVPIEDIVPITDTYDVASAGEGLKLRGEVLDDFVPLIETALNLYNMNNPEVQQSRADRDSLNEDQQLLLANANLSQEISTALGVFPLDNMPTGLPPIVLSQLAASIPNDAALRPVVCNFYNESPQVCIDADETDPSFFHKSTYADLQDENGDSLQIQMEVDDGVPIRRLGLDLGLGVVWLDNNGNDVTHSRIDMRVMLSSFSGADDTQRNVTIEDAPDDVTNYS